MRYLKHNSRMDIHNDHHATKPEPFPIMATISVGIAMFANNIAMSNLFSYVGFMVVHLKVVQTKEESGLGSSASGIDRMGSGTGTESVWETISDTYGSGRSVASNIDNFSATGDIYFSNSQMQSQLQMVFGVRMLKMLPMVQLATMSTH